MLNEKGKPMSASEKAKLAYKTVQELTGDEKVPGNDDFESWVLRCMVAINEKLKEKPAAPKITPKATTGSK